VAGVLVAGVDVAYIVVGVVAMAVITSTRSRARTAAPVPQAHGARCSYRPTLGK
jgi:hypothetical protein